MLKNKLPGIVLAVAVMLVAKFLSGYIPYLGVTLLALIFGIIVRQFLKSFTLFASGIAWSEKYILELAIVLIGFGFEISRFNYIGLSTLFMLFGSIVVVILVALLLGKILGQNESKLYWLLGAGSAICGSSAIGATAPLIEAKEEETGLALGVINLLGLFGMLLLPLIALVLDYSDVESGILLGGILQSVGHVIGAGFSVNESTGEFATVVKMGRISFLIPFLITIFFLFRKKKDGTKMKFPIFIVLFLMAVVLSQVGIFNESNLKLISKTGDTFLNIGMAAIGLKINIKSLWQISGKALLAGVIIFIFQIASFVVFIAIR